MQQIESKHRFWWRAAHDAPTPKPEAAHWDASREPATQGRAAPASAIKRSPLKLQIPRGERRFRRSRRGRVWFKPAALFGAAIVATAAAAYALPLDQLRAVNVGGKANELMIAAGFGIDQVNVSGQHYAADSDVFDALDLPNVKTFAAFDSEAALKRIERISWVETAQITRVYPGTLDVVVHERVPAFIWRRGETNYLVDATGRTLGPMPAASAWNLPRVVGEGADGEAMLMLAAVRQYPRIEREYAYGERVAERRWRIVLKNGAVLDLAADREIEGLEQIVNTRAAVPALTGKPMIIDVRTPGRIAMRPAGAIAIRTSSVATSGTTSVASAQQ